MKVGGEDPRRARGRRSDICPASVPAVGRTEERAGRRAPRGSSSAISTIPTPRFDLPLLVEGTPFQRRLVGCDVRDSARQDAHLRRARDAPGRRAARGRPGVRRQPAADRHSLPPRGRRRRHRRLRALDRRLSGRGEALAARARARGRRFELEPERATRGSSTRSATRSGSRTGCRRTRSPPTAPTCEQLALRRKELLEVERGRPVRASSPRASGRASSAARLVSSLKRFYRTACASGASRPTRPSSSIRRSARRAFRSTLSEADVEALLAAPEGLDRARPARPRDARDAVRDRPARLRARAR